MLEKGVLLKGRGRGGSVRRSMDYVETDELPGSMGKSDPSPMGVSALATVQAKPISCSRNSRNSESSKSLESWIWEAACSIRGAKDAPKYKDYILPLIFTKRLCDVFDDEINDIAAAYSGAIRTGNPKLFGHQSRVNSDTNPEQFGQESGDYSDSFGHCRNGVRNVSE